MSLPHIRRWAAGTGLDCVRSAGYKWVLQREGEDAHSSQQAGPSSRERERYRGMGRATPPELERLHSALQQKEEQLASYQETISELEATRDRSPPPPPGDPKPRHTKFNMCGNVLCEYYLSLIPLKFCDDRS
jgi:hypothetical protein